MRESLSNFHFDFNRDLDRPVPRKDAVRSNKRRQIRSTLSIKTASSSNSLPDHGGKGLDETVGYQGTSLPSFTSQKKTNCIVCRVAPDHKALASFDHHPNTLMILSGISLRVDHY